jgi:hypothetical protein
MKIPYRVTSGMAAVATVVLPVASNFLPPRPPRHLPPAPAGAIAWDPCTAWVQYAPMYRLVVLVCFAALTVVLVQGFRNRPGPRWLAIAGVPALAAAIMSDWWRISAGCYSSGGVTLLFIWAGIVNLMFLHHAVQPRTALSELSGGRARRWPALVWHSIFQALVFLPIAWSILNGFRDWRHGDGTTFAQAVIIAIQHCIAWAMIFLFFLAIGICFYWFVSRLRGATRA